MDNKKTNTIKEKSDFLKTRTIDRIIIHTAEQDTAAELVVASVVPINEHTTNPHAGGDYIIDEQGVRTKIR